MLKYGSAFYRTIRQPVGGRHASVAGYATETKSVTRTQTERNTSSHSIELRARSNAANVIQLMRKVEDHYHGSLPFAEAQVLEALSQLEKGWGSDTDFDDAVRSAGPDALHRLAQTIYGISLSGDPSYRRMQSIAAGLAWLSAEHGSNAGHLLYSRMLLSGHGMTKTATGSSVSLGSKADSTNPLANEAFARILTLCVVDYPPALHLAGQLFLEGKEGATVPDPVIAKQYFERAAAAGVLEALTTLGVAYSDPKYRLGVDEEKALDLVSMAAAKGDFLAHMTLARWYSQGRIVDKQCYITAFAHHRTAAYTGRPMALHNVGTHYVSGRGVEHDMKSAAKWFSLAAMKGFTLSQLNLGQLYWHGKGVEKDMEKALYWLNLAAEGGNKNAEALATYVEKDIRGELDHEEPELQNLSSNTETSDDGAIPGSHRQSRNP
eukprot:Clim_evm17s211 gene=Clim_evmTU17s211